MLKFIAGISIDELPFLRKRSNTRKRAKRFKTLSDKLSIEEYMTTFIDLKKEGVVLVNSRKASDFDTFLNIDYNSIINFQRINDIRYINKYFEKVNSLLPQNGVYIGTFESSKQRKIRILNKYPIVIAYLFHFATFVLKRYFRNGR